MSNERKEDIGEVFIMIRVAKGKVAHDGRWGKATANDISLAMTHLEWIKKDLLEVYKKIMKKK